MTTGFGVQRIDRDDLPAGKVLCEYCTAKCCRYFALPIETPEDFSDFGVSALVLVARAGHDL